MTKRLRIATRGSQLALWQAEHVRALLVKMNAEIEVEFEIVISHGDANRDRPLYALGGVGIFTKEVQEAILDGRADLAVHSLKDLPTAAHPKLCLAAVPTRGDVEDVLLSPKHQTLANLPTGARVATSSLRRQAQLRGLRPDLMMESIRGNVETRIRKLHEENLDGLVLARAGLERLGLEKHITEVLPAKVILPAVGQGALGIECRREDADLRAILARLEDGTTRQRVDAERALLRRLEGGCQVPLGVNSTIEGDILILDAIVLRPDGSRSIKGRIEGPASQAEELGVGLADELLASGAADLLN